MTLGTSRHIQSSQDGPHPRLAETVQRHRVGFFDRPIADHNAAVFAEVHARVIETARPVVFDSGCGVGESTARLAERFVNHLVVGVDKSADRLRRAGDLPRNAIIVRADLMDMYRLVAKAGWPVTHHFILYPNPWPKPGHLGRRWHGSPVFPAIMAMGGALELRTNWGIYAEEFATAVSAYGINASVEDFNPDGEYLTPFERKYDVSGQRLIRVTARRPSTEVGGRFQVGANSGIVDEPC